VTPEAGTGTLSVASAEPRSSNAAAWIAAVVPLLLLAALIAWIVRSGPAETVRGAAYPPVERLSIQRVVLEPGMMRATVFNDGPDPVTIAQVVVDDAFWQFQAIGGATLRHLQRTTLAIPYPWVYGEPHVIRVVTSTGGTFDHTIAVSVPTPEPGARSLAVFAAIGAYVGVLPVAIGLLWYPWIRRLGPAGLEFVLALTVGLLVFLLVDTIHDGSEVAASLPGSFQGSAVLFAGAAAAYLGLEAFGRALRARRRGEGSRGRMLALLVAVGIGFHNFGEGLAIGSAFALGQAALGTLLIVGFTLHNTTEGLAIFAPLARDAGPRAPLGTLVWLGLVGGAPTVAGAWVGGFTSSPGWSLVFLAFGIGAIGQVSVQILQQMRAARPWGEFVSTGRVLGGLAAGFAVMYVTGLLVG